MKISHLLVMTLLFSPLAGTFANAEEPANSKKNIQALLDCYAIFSDDPNAENYPEVRQRFPVYFKTKGANQGQQAVIADLDSTNLNHVKGYYVFSREEIRYYSVPNPEPLASLAKTGGGTQHACYQFQSYMHSISSGVEAPVAFKGDDAKNHWLNEGANCPNGARYPLEKYDVLTDDSAVQIALMERVKSQVQLAIGPFSYLKSVDPDFSYRHMGRGSNLSGEQCNNVFSAIKARRGRIRQCENKLKTLPDYLKVPLKDPLQRVAKAIGESEKIYKNGTLCSGETKVQSGSESSGARTGY